MLISNSYSNILPGIIRPFHFNTITQFDPPNMTTLQPESKVELQEETDIPAELDLE